MFRLNKHKDTDINTDGDKNVVRKQIRFVGRVQSVGFRYSAMYFAQDLGLTGWVTNEWDDTVTMEVQGPQEDIDKLLHKLHNKPPIRIDSMGILNLPLKKERGFHVR